MSRGLDAGIRIRFERRVDHHVLRRLVVVLAELAAADADDGDFLFEVHLVTPDAWVGGYGVRGLQSASEPTIPTVTDSITPSNPNA
jgi:hypothetical protein